MQNELTAEVRGPPRVHFGPGIMTGCSVGLQLVTQQALLAVVATHVVDTAPEEGVRHDLADALPGARNQ